jgi:hypothetical protein
MAIVIGGLNLLATSICTATASPADTSVATALSQTCPSVETCESDLRRKP